MSGRVFKRVMGLSPVWLMLGRERSLLCKD